MALFPGSKPILTLSRPRKRRPAVDRRQLQTVEEAEAARAAIEFATLKRQAADIFNVALRDAEESPDEESASKILETAKAGVFGLKSPNIRVQNALSAHLQGSLPGWEDRFARQTKVAKEKRIHDQGLQEYDAALDSGDLVGAVKITEHLKTIEPENSAIYDKMASDAPNASALRQVRGAVADNNLARARELIEQARQLPLTIEQKEDLDKMEGAVGRGEREQVVQARVELLTEADKAMGLPDVERFTAIEQIKARYAQVAESPEDLRATFNWLDSIAEGKPFKVDPQAEIEANDIIAGLDADSTPQEIGAARSKILALQEGLGPDVVKFIKELGTRLDGEKTKAVEYAVDDAVARGQIDRAYGPILRRDLERWVNRQKGDVAPVDIISRGAALAAMMPETARPEVKPPKEVYTPFQINRVFGALEIGGYRHPESGAIVTWRDDDWSMAWEKAVAYATLNLYGDDASLAEAMQIIKRRYPEADIEPGRVSVPWTSLPEEVKQQDLDMLRKTKRAPWYSTSVYEPVGGWPAEAVAKAKEEGMTVAKFSTWLTEQGQIRMVPSPAPQAAPDAVPATVPPVRASIRGEVEALAPGTHYIWTDGKERIKQ